MASEGSATEREPASGSRGGREFGRARGRAAATVGGVGKPRSESHEERIEVREIHYARDARSFDRIAFAMRALRLLRPNHMTVAVYESITTLRIESMLDLRRRDGSTQATVGIPPDASREHIAYALAELAGKAEVPYVVELLLADRGPDA